MKRVVITGVGVITPVGNDVCSFWESITKSKSGIDYIKSYDTTDTPIKVAAEVKNYDWKDYFKPIDIKRLDRFTQFALISSQEAYNDSRLNESIIDHERLGVVYSSGIGGSSIGTEYNRMIEKGFKYVSALTIPFNLVNMAAGNIAIKFKAYGSCSSLVSACATGTDCIGQAYRQIQRGEQDVIIAGSSESGINPLLIAAFSSLKALSRSDNPERASIPFDKERNGFVMGEGAGTLILEELDHAIKRNAKIYAEVVGYGSTCDAYNIVSPAPDLKQGIRAIKMALSDANIEYKDISYINAHGTSTIYNDKFESKIIEEVFYKDGNLVPVSSTKSMTGHLLGAAGSVEAVICAKSLEDNFIPATIGYKVKDEEFNLNYITNEGKREKLNYVLSNSLGFGGHNSALIFKNKDLI
ncbi:beta-ketoacyl-ACP synthase II [Clostridium sp. LP20]|uniref:beta-ketoacyl-ACP synthase II n=1 Tax=Clostridium sp. LP20 TaxID=3418665 RepID=UPI003EE72EFE